MLNLVVVFIFFASLFIFLGYGGFNREMGKRAFASGFPDAHNLITQGYYDIHLSGRSSRSFYTIIAVVSGIL